MRKNRFFSLLIGATMLVAAAASLTACHEDDNNESPVGPVAGATFSYQASVFGPKDSHRILLDSLSSVPTSITSSASWLTATADAGLNSESHPTIIIESTAPADKNDNEATINVNTENGEQAIIHVRHSPFARSDSESGANSDWVNNWWEYDKVALQGIPDDQYAPWVVETSVRIPNSVRKQYKPSQGWEMAFSYLNDNSLEGVRYFALYNKWTGLVHVYTYIRDPSGWGNDLMFNLQFGEHNDNDMFPLYNLHEYGIPTSHVIGSTLSRDAKILQYQTQTFETWVSPYSKPNTSLGKGWYCFEFDMSGYVPNGKDWLKPNENEARLYIRSQTINNQTVKLTGAIRGDIDGTFSNPQIIQNGGANATSSIFSALGGGLSSISGMASSSISSGNAYATAMKNDPTSKLTPVKYWGGFACSIAGALLSYQGSVLEDPISYDTIPGTINLTLDASVALDGYMKSITPNNIGDIGVSASGIYTANRGSGTKNGHVGKGVWSLAEDPVVYIDKDDIITTAHKFDLHCTPTGYHIGTFQNYNARIVYAFDPTSVKLNINTDLFKGIDSVTVTANVGVFPNQPYGHTDCYRQMLMLGQRPSFSLAPGKTSGTITLSSNYDESEPVITLVDLNSLADGDYETADNCKTVTQKMSDGTGWQRFHGRLIELPEMNKQIIVDPQVFIPYAVDGSGNETTIGFPTAPDFVVRIDVQFIALDDNGERKRFQFGKLYIPKIEIVSWDDMCDVYARLKDYSTKCQKKQPINTLANDSKVQVRFPGGDRLIGKTLRLLDRICDVD